MKRILLVLVLIALIASPAAAQGIEPKDLISGEDYTITLEVDTNVDNVDQQGPVSVNNWAESDGTLSIDISASGVDERMEAKLFVEYVDGNDDVIEFKVWPRPDPDGQAISGDVKDDAQKWRAFEDTWINQRIDEKVTSEGKLVTYEQRDPTRGEVDPETGLPKGEWVEVPVDEDTGEPQWFAEDPEEMLIYTSQQSKTKRGFRHQMIMGAAGIIALSWIGQFWLLPQYRQYRQQAGWYDNTSFVGHLLPWK